MKFNTVFGTLLCAEAALAARFTQQRRDRAAKRAFQRSTLPRLPADGTASQSLEAGNDTAHVEYSSNWAGAVLIGTGYTSVTGTIVVPTPETPSGGSSRTEYAASAWVGIDGDTCQTAIVQTGVDFYVEGSEVAFDAWYEWYPDYAYDFSGITISAGDTVTMTVTATSKSAGTAVIENQTTGTTVTHSFSGETDTLCETNAEWIVEDFSSGGSLVPFADFGTVTFTDASATTSSGTVGVSGATIIDIEQSNEVLTDCSTSGDSEVTCTYTG
ncbi:acid proteinase [Seiridium cupressi]